MVRLPKGTKEFLVVVVTDKLQTLTNLATANSVRFDVLNQDGTTRVSDGVCDVDGMAAMALVDTTGWTEGEYKLFIKIDTGVQKPVLGPFKFEVEDYVITP